MPELEGHFENFTATELVDELNDVTSGLTDWEVEFIDKMTERVRKSWPLSDRQLAKLKQIAADRVEPPA